MRKVVRQQRWKELLGGIILLLNMSQLEQGGSESQSELLLSYLCGSTYFQHLRNTYPHFLRLSQEERRNLVHSAELFRVKEDRATLLINYNQPTVCIIVYGQARWGGRIYAKGAYFTAGFGQQQVDFLKKTAVLMLNKAHLEDSLRQTEQFYTKIDILQRILPVQLLGLQRRGYKMLNSFAEMHSGTGDKLQALNPQQRLGVFVLHQGTFVVVSRRGLRLTQLCNDYFGEETLWSDHFQYILRPESYEYKYIFIAKEAFLQILTPQMMLHLRDFFSKKQKLRTDIEQNYQRNLQLTQNFLKTSPTRQPKKRFTPQQVVEFTQILSNMGKKGHRPKWRREEDELQRQRLQKLKEKRVYMPKKVKSKYFSTLTDSTFDFAYHQTLHQQQSIGPYQPKLHLHQRAKTQIIFKRAQTSPSPEHTKCTSPDNSAEFHRLNSHRYYSHNYDRSYSVGMSNLAKMRKYDQLKKTSTLRRGEKILSRSELQKQLRQSFQELRASNSLSARDKKIDPEIIMMRTMKQTQLLVDKHMQKTASGFSTWR